MSQIYKDAGVNLSAGDELSKHAAAMTRESWSNSPFVKVFDHSRGSFRGPRTFLPIHLQDGCQFLPGADGIGTKLGLIAEALTHGQAAIDLAAMLGGDQTRYGAMPLILGNVVDAASIKEVGSTTYECFEKLFRGLRDAAADEGVVLLGGEIAELGVFVGSENPDAVTKLNWSGFMLGAYHPRTAITGERIAPGQCIRALREYGFRSNGFSAVRKSFRHRFGAEWWKNPQAKDAIRRAAEPSTLYDRFFVKANGWHHPQFADRIPVAGIAHLTGGGIPGKLGDLLAPTGHSALLEDLWSPPEIMRECAESLRALTTDRAVNDGEFYETWGGGQGALVILDEEDAHKFDALAAAFSLESKPCGKIVSSEGGTPTIRIRSKFSDDEPLLEFPIGH